MKPTALSAVLLSGLLVGLASADPAAGPATQPVAETAPQPAAAPEAPVGVEVTRPDGLKVTVLNAGDPGAKIGDVVSVHYTGSLLNGTVFDSSVGGDPLQLRLGENRVIKGWELGIPGMVLGEKRRLVIPPELAYGPRNVGSGITANSTLVFDIQLVGIARK